MQWFALYKPPFWPVSNDCNGFKGMAKAALVTPVEDEDDVITEDEMPSEEGRQKLSIQSWMQPQLASYYPICQDPIANFGVMHRLDVQTSGVLLCAKSYVGAYWIVMQ